MVYWKRGKKAGPGGASLWAPDLPGETWFGGTRQVSDGKLRVFVGLSFPLRSRRMHIGSGRWRRREMVLGTEGEGSRGWRGQRTFWAGTERACCLCCVLQPCTPKQGGGVSSAQS